MRPERWQRLNVLFDAALALPAAARPQFVAAACADDEGLRAELTALLAAHQEPGILDGPTPALRATVAEPWRVPPATLAAGARLGPYEVVALLGAGGMGEVYRARDPRLGREVAIKRVRGAEPGADALRRFDQEARAAGSLNHPNLLVVYDVGVEGSTPYVVTELLEGETLRQRLRCGAMPPGEVARVARQIASGLTAAHEKGILHRDLKPENLFLTLDGRLKILDFGLAKRLGVVEPPAGGSAPARADQTAAGIVVGTLGYTAPEQLRGLPPEPRSDLFALGAVLYEMLSSRRAFPGETPLAILGAVLADEPPPLAGPPPTAALERLVRRCLAKRPEERPSSARELVAALDELAAREARGPAGTALAAGAESRALAVLPFLNLTGDPGQEYLCEGIAEELLHALGRLPGLRVAARSSSFRFKGQEDAIRRLGRELGVDTVLEGSVRQAGERMRIAVQLVAVADACHLWSARYDVGTGDVLSVEEEIAARVASALRLRLAPAVERPRPASPEAYHLFLKGRYHWNKRHAGGLRQGVRAFEAAIEHDPLYARAWAALAESHALLGLSLFDVMPTRESMPRAKAAALKALEIDPELPEAYAALGWVRFHHDWDWGGAEHDFRQSLELGPEVATTRHWYSFFLSVMGRAEEAQEQARRALQLDPLSLIVTANLAQPAYYARRFGEAAAAAGKLVELEPAFALAHYWLGLALAGQGDHARALAAFVAFAELFGETSRAAALVGHCQGRTGNAEAALATLAELRALAARRPVPAYHFALVHLGLGDAGAALDALEEAAREGSDALAYLAVDPLLDPLREERRFVDLLRRVGLDGVVARLHGASGLVAPGVARRSVAVLPFAEEGFGEATRGIGLGLADAVITELAQLDTLVVRPTSTIVGYDGRWPDPGEAGRELGVDGVLVGRIERPGDRLRVSVSLVATVGGAELWSSDTEGDAGDLFALQDELSRRVATALAGSTATPDSSPRQRPAALAYDLYLQGKAHLLRETQGELEAAIDCFERARDADLEFAPAVAGLADAYGRMAFNFAPEADWYPRAEAMCEAALRLDPALPEGLYARGRLRWSPQGGWDNAGALRDFCRAVTARPGFDEAHIRLGVVLYHVGLVDLGVRHFEHALAIAPEHALASYQLGFCRYHQGRYAEALEIAEAVARRAPAAWILYQTACCQLRLGRLSDADETAARIARDFPADVLVHPIRALVAARRGDEAAARAEARATAASHYLFGHYHHAQYDLACIHALFGEADAAVRELRAAARNGYPCGTMFEGDPLLAPLHEHAPFRALLDELRVERQGYEALHAELTARR